MEHTQPRSRRDPERQRPARIHCLNITPQRLGCEDTISSSSPKKYEQQVISCYYDIIIMRTQNCYHHKAALSHCQLPLLGLYIPQCWFLLHTLISCPLLSKTVCCHTSRHIPCDVMVSISCYVINEFQQRVLLKSAKTKSNTVWQDDAGANHHVGRQEPGSPGFYMRGSFSWGFQKDSFILMSLSVQGF